ncbi:hypothetical protein ACFOWZ_25290 [Lentzea rhizosphaerae]|uniref:Uncharacterized protein n=1 Tax=Lentzea rhizosphaerae TaxID=2041025 RepID=A0ABV8BYK2_9PSEU
MLTRLTVIVLLLLCLCGEKQQVLPDDMDLDAVAYPLDAYDLSEHEMVVVARAKYLMAQRCVRQLGADLPPFPTGRMRAPQDDRYGLASRHTAWEWGYSLDKPPVRVIPWELQIDPRSRLHSLLNDGPDGGCLGSANRALAEPTTNPLPRLDDEAWRASRDKPAVRQAAQAWHRCTARAGLDYDDPVEAPYYHWGEKRIAAHRTLTEEDRRNGLRPSGTERRAALVDVRCKVESGFLRAWAEADVAAQRELVRRHLGELTERRRALDLLVRSAETVNG